MKRQLGHTSSTGSNSPLLEAVPSPLNVPGHDNDDDDDDDEFLWHQRNVKHSRDDVSDADTTRLPWDDTVHSESIGAPSETFGPRQPSILRMSTTIKRTAGGESESLGGRRASMTTLDSVDIACRASPVKRIGIRHRPCDTPPMPFSADSRASTADPPPTDMYASPAVMNARRPSGHNAARVSTTSSSAGGKRAAEKSGNLAWHELEPLDCDLNLPSFWIQLLNTLHAQSEEWAQQMQALTTVRRIALHDPSRLEDTPVPACQARKAIMGPFLLSKVVALADSLRSAVARNAMLAINDLFLFAPAEIESPGIVDALGLCLKKASGPGGQFLMEEAERAWRQAVLVGDPLRVFLHLSGALAKLTKSSPVLRSKYINAIAFFCLRLSTTAFKTVIEHKDFAGTVLKVIFKSTGDANQDCRTAGARCLIVFFNLIPDLLQRFRSALVDIDIHQIANRVRRTPVFDVKGFYGITGLEVSYRTLPPAASCGRACLNLQIITDNVDAIVKNPLHLSSVPSSTLTKSKTKRTDGRGDTPGGFPPEASSPRAMSAVPGSGLSRPTMSTVSSIVGCRATTAAASRLANPICSNRPTTPIKSRSQIYSGPRAPSALRPDDRHEDPRRTLDDAYWLPDEEEEEEDTPWTAGGARYVANRSRRESVTRVTPVRSHTPFQGRPGAVTPTTVLAGRSATRPRQEETWHCDRRTMAAQDRRRW